MHVLLKRMNYNLVLLANAKLTQQQCFLHTSTSMNFPKKIRNLGHS